VTVYVERLAERLFVRASVSAGAAGDAGAARSTAGVQRATLDAIRLANPFLLRSVDPRVGEVVGRVALGTRRVGKRVVIELEGELFVVIHLMIAGRLQWEARSAKIPPIPRRVGAAAFDFSTGTLLLTEASTKKRASLHLVRGEAALAAIDPGGVEPLVVDASAFEAALRRERHTLKRTLTDPRIFSGIGNAYSDEILHRARLSPVTLSTSLDADAVARLYAATRAVLGDWTERLRAEADADPRGDGWPRKVTAFREGMAVHGRYGLPCPVCGENVQRIAYAENETNYCATCQTGGRLLADRSLSRLLRDDWPRTLEELEALKRK
jgi:formamidopyrimidine-DNA glycosylase